MQDTDSTYESNLKVHQHRPPLFRRLVPLYAVLLALLLITLLLPFININRFQRKIVTSLSESIGRPIHLDRISLTLLPLPGLTIENLVVGEDPAFGAEPFVRANTVRATFRVSSLWRHRVEFTKISFTEPTSINLVETSQGKWNLESILLQAAKLQAAPTAQARAGSAPRFPYIEATGARINMKRASEKLPISLTDAEFALWLPSPQEWQLRLQGRPARTDMSVFETGTLQMEGTLGRATSLNEVPIDLKGEWRNVPLGGASQIMLGRDAELRGSMTLSATAHGTIGKSTIQTLLHLADLRRAEFIPEHAISFDIECQATQLATFHTLSDVRCSWPPASLPNAKTFALTGSVPDLRNLSSSSFELGTPGIPAATLVDWVHVASARVSPDITATGSLTGSLFYQPSSQGTLPWTGQLLLSNANLTVPSVATTPVFSGDLTLHSAQPASDRQRGTRHRTPQPFHNQFTLSPIPLTLGEHDSATLEGTFDDTGYSLHLTGTALPSKLLALGAALPQLGDGLASALPPATVKNPVHIDLTSTRPWGGSQTWHSTEIAAAPRHHSRR